MHARRPSPHADRAFAQHLGLAHSAADARPDVPDGDLYLVADNLASHLSGPIRDWLADRPRIHHAFIPVGAAWLNLIEEWWRLFRRKAFAGESLADADDIAYVTDLASAHLNRHVQPWV